VKTPLAAWSFVIGALVGLPLPVQGTGPATVQQTGDTTVLSNDYLERTIEVKDDLVRTTQLSNKISHRLYVVSGFEFEIELLWEGSRFHEPQIVTSQDFKVVKREMTEIPNGGQGLVFHLNGKETFNGWGMSHLDLETILVYELRPEDYYTRQWIVLRNTGKQKVSFFVHSLDVLKAKWDPQYGFPTSVVERGKKLRDCAYRTVEAARRAGVSMAMGADAGPHGKNARELVRMVEAGLSPMEGIVAATSIAARACGIQKNVGTVVPGKVADLVVIDGDPIRDVRVFLNPESFWLVLQEGKAV